MRKVLVADSANITHFAIERILNREGWEVHYVKYPRDLIGQLRNLKPDVLFLEPEISGGKGRKIVDYLASQVDITLPIVLITRITDSDKYQMADWPGVHEIIRKPLNSDKVIHAISSINFQAVQLREKKAV